MHCFRLFIVIDIHISQGSVTTPLRCGGIFNDFLIASFLLSLTVKHQHLRACVRAGCGHLEHVKMMWLTTRLTIFETITASRVCRYSTIHWHVCNYCVDVSIWHFEFPKVVLARTSGEVGILCTVLLSVYSGTRLPIFIEIGSYLTDTEQKISWHSFIETRCIYTYVSYGVDWVIAGLKNTLAVMDGSEAHPQCLSKVDDFVTL